MKTDYRPNPQNPATWLKPDEKLMCCKYDISWMYIIFGDIEDYPGYKVDSEGGFWSKWSSKPVAGYGRRSGTERFQKEKWKRLTGSPGSHGYLMVQVSNDNEKRKKCIHDFVLNSLYMKRPGSQYEYEARHIDGKRSNNRLINLRWGTHSENQMDRVEHGTSNRGSRHPNSKLTEEHALKIVDLWNSGHSVRQICLKVPVKLRAVYCVLRGERWSHLTGIMVPLTRQLNK